MSDIHFIFRMMALSQALLLAVLLLRNRSTLFQPYRVACLTATTVLAFCAYLILPFTADWPNWLTVLLEAVASAVPAILWLNAYWLFEDRHIVPLWLIILTPTYVFIWLMPGAWQVELISPGAIHDLVFSLIPQVIKLALVIHVLYLALVGRQRDLVDARLRIRFPLAMGGGVLASLVIIVEIWSDGTVSPFLEDVGSIVMFTLAFAANVIFVSFGLAGPRPKIPAPAPSIPSSHSDETLEEIRRAMDARFYANHGATLDDLAAQLGIPAYRLRKLINENLGHRNFNQFLNRYRIDEASRRIKMESSPILTIALDVGFKSLSSFNAAFRNRHGVTPSAYRQQPDTLTDS